MNLSVIAAIIYGILAIAGGIMGYSKAKSEASLISGLISGLLLLGSSLLQLVGYEWARWLSIVIIGALVVVFIKRFQKTKKWMPAGLMIVIGAIALVVSII